MNEPDNRDPRLDAAYREAPRDEPPAELDERIRAAARRAVSAGPESFDAAERVRDRRSWAARWRVPVSLAATVVVVVTLTVMMQDEESRRARLDTPMNGAHPAAAPDSATLEAEAARADARVASPPPAQPFKPQVPVPEEQRAPAPRAPAELESPSASGALSKELENRQTEVAPAPPPAVQAAPAAPAAIPPPPQAKPAPQASPPPAARELMRSAPSGAADAQLERDRALADRPGRLERGAAAPAAAEAKVRTPDAWIEEIRRLKAQGRDAEAAAELAEFRKRHPDYTLPPDLAK
jgi:hypothetical protein